MVLTRVEEQLLCFATVILSLKQLLINLLVFATVLRPQKKMKRLNYFNVLGDLSLMLRMCFAKIIQK